jgi:glucose-1-phosphate thymidylyltransferase
MELLGRGMAWLDMGTCDSLNDAASYIRTIEARTGLKICCPEEIAWRQRFIDTAQLVRLADALGTGGYADYLRDIARDGSR